MHKTTGYLSVEKHDFPLVELEFKENDSVLKMLNNGGGK